MAEYTVASLIDLLQNNYKADDVLVATWWSREDITIVLDDEGWGADPDEVWRQVSSNVDVALDYAESDINGELHGFVESVVMRGEQ